jgi:hypothetical protein
MVAATALLTARNLSTGYRSRAKRIVIADTLPELRLQPGQLTCLLGPNGSANPPYYARSAAFNRHWAERSMSRGWTGGHRQHWPEK